jgi:hypothetical protein
VCTRIARFACPRGVGLEIALSQSCACERGLFERALANVMTTAPTIVLSLREAERDKAAA